MSSPGQTPKHVKSDERNHVDNPLLDPLEALRRDVVALADRRQTPTDVHRDCFDVNDETTLGRGHAMQATMSHLN